MSGLTDDLDKASERDDLPAEIKELLADASNSITELEAEVDDTNDAASEAERQVDAMEADEGFANVIYEAIVEGRIEDAVDALSKAFDTSFMSPASYRDLFKSRVRHG